MSRIQKAKDKEISTVKVEKFEAIEGKGVRANYNGQVAFVGSNRLLVDVNISREIASREKNYRTKLKQLFMWALMGK